MADVLIEKLTAELGADAAQMIAAFVATERAAENAAKAVEAASRKAERDVEKAANKAEKETRRSAREAEKAARQTEKAMREAARSAEKAAKDAAREAEKAAKAVRDDFANSYTELKAKIDLAWFAASKFYAVIRSGVSTLAGWISKTREYANALELASRTTGLTVEKVQALRFALRDASPEDVTKGMDKLAQVIGESLRVPTSETAKVFQQLGINLRDASGNARGTDQVMLDLADRFKAMGSASERTAVASKLLGEETGKKLAKEMAIGSEGILQQMEAAEKLGFVMSGKTLESTKRYDDAMTRLNLATTGMQRAMVALAIPALTEIAEGFIRGHSSGNLLVGTIEGLRKGWAQFQASLAGVGSADIEIRDLDKTILSTVQQLNAARLKRSTGSAAEFLGLTPDVNPELEKRLALQLKGLLDKRDKIVEEREAPILGPTPKDPKDDDQGPAFSFLPDEDAMVKSAEARIKATQDIFEAEQKHHELLIDLVEKEDADRARIDEEKIRAAKAVTDEQERQVASLIRSYETNAEARDREIQQVRDLALVNAEVRGQEQQLIDRVNEKFDKLDAQAKKTTDSMAKASQAAAKQMKSAFVDFLIDPVNKGLSGLADGWINSLKRMAAEQLASGLFGGGKGAGGFLGLFGGATKKAGGGPVFGPGGPRDDAIPAMLSNGEFVLNAASVKLTNRMFGSDFLRSWNAMGTPPLPRAPRISTDGMPRRFADGGFVTPAAPVAPGATTLDLSIINVSSKEAALEALRGPAGRDIVMNHIGADGGHRAQRALGLKG